MTGRAPGEKSAYLRLLAIGDIDDAVVQKRQLEVYPETSGPLISPDEWRRHDRTYLCPTFSITHKGLSLRFDKASKITP